jgi:alpha-L-fucosidase 2
MLIQSYNDRIEIFPAIPNSWKDVSFHNLRTEGAFLVSAKKENGVADQVTITAGQTNRLFIKLPFKTWLVKGIERKEIDDNGNNISTVFLKKGQTIVFKNGYE